MLGGQPVVQPNGTVVSADANGDLTDPVRAPLDRRRRAAGRRQTITASTRTQSPGASRSGPLPSAEIDGTGRVYVVWADCRFRNGLQHNDIVFATSTNGKSW